MKLTIERLTTLTHQDLIDLAKIWPEQQPTVWQQWINDDKPLFAARFNERLLGAVTVMIKDEQAELEDLCIREVTRRRGVGLYLIEETVRQLSGVRYWHLRDEQVTAVNRIVMDSFMHACGFTRTTQGWQR